VCCNWVRIEKSHESDGENASCQKFLLWCGDNISCKSGFSHSYFPESRRTAKNE